MHETTTQTWAVTIDGEVYATADSYEEGRDFARRHGLARFGVVAVVPFEPAE
jgi:hypothetical protein